MKKLMCWACFCYNGVGRIFRINGLMNAHDYRKILIHQLKPSADALFRNGEWVLQQDNDPNTYSKNR